MGTDHRIRERHEEVVEDVAGVLIIQPVDRPARVREMDVGSTVAIGLQLAKQARDKVDRAGELGDLFQMERHPQVILGCMKPHPRHGVFAPEIIGVVRLMLVP